MKSSYIKDEKQVVKKLIEKYLKSGFESLSLEELAITIINPLFERSYKLETGTEWPKEHKKKAIERLQKSKFNIQWSLNENKKNIPIHSKFGYIIKLCEKDNEEKLNEIFRENAQYMKEIINTLDENKKSLLHIASKRGNVNMIKFLITKGFNIYSRDKYLRTPFLIACQFGRLKASELLLDYGSEIYAKDSIGRTCLHYSICSDSSLLVKLILDKEKSLIYSKDTYGRTPLHYAIFNNTMFQTEMIKMLIDYGCDINCLDDEKMTPLHFASENAKNKIIPILMKKGADPFLVCDRNNQNSLDIAPNDKIKELIMKYCNGEYKSEINQKKLKSKFENGKRNNYINGKSNNNKDNSYSDDLMYNTNRNKLISFLKNIQDYGIKTQQHLNKPELYSGSWLEKVNNINELYTFFGKYTPHESALAIYNIMIPFVSPLPKGKNEDKNMNLFFNQTKGNNNLQIQSSNNNISPNNIGFSSAQGFSISNNDNNSNNNNINNEDLNFNENEEGMVNQFILQKKEINDLKEEIKNLSKKIEDEKKNKENAELIKIKMEIEKCKNENEMLKNNENNLSAQINFLSENVKKYEEVTGKLEEKEQIQKDMIINNLNNQLQDINSKLEKIKYDKKDNNNNVKRFRSNSPSYKTFLNNINLDINEEMHVYSLCLLAEKDDGLYDILIKFDKDNDMHIFKNEFLEVLDYLNLPFEHRDTIIKLIGFENNMKLPINKIVNLIYNREKSKIYLLNQSLFNIVNKICDTGKNIEELYNDLNNKSQNGIVGYEDAAPILINKYFIKENDVKNLFTYWSDLDSNLMNNINNTIELQSFKSKLEERKKIIDLIVEKYGKQQPKFQNKIIINQYNENQKYNQTQNFDEKNNDNYQTFSNKNISSSNNNNSSSNNNNNNSNTMKSDIYKSDIYKNDNEKSYNFTKSNYKNPHDEELTNKNENKIKKQMDDEIEYYGDFENEEVDDNNNHNDNENYNENNNEDEDDNNEIKEKSENNDSYENHENELSNEEDKRKNDDDEKENVVIKKESNELIESNEIEDLEQSKIKSKNTTSSILEISNINDKLVSSKSTLKKSSSSSNKTKTLKNYNNSNLNEEEEIENDESNNNNNNKIKNNKKETTNKRNIKIDPNEVFNGEIKVQVKNIENIILPKNIKSPYSFNLKLLLEGINQSNSSKEIKSNDLDDITVNWSSRILLRKKTLKDIGSKIKIILESNINNENINLGETTFNWIICLNKINYDQYIIDDKYQILNKKKKPIGNIKIKCKFIPFGYNTSNYEKNGKKKKPGTSNNTIKEESATESLSKIKKQKDNSEDNSDFTLIKEIDIEINSISKIENDNLYLSVFSKDNNNENEVYSSKNQENLNDIIKKIPFTFNINVYSTIQKKNIVIIFKFKKYDDDSVVCEGNVNLSNKEKNLSVIKNFKLSGEENVDINAKFNINTIQDDD